MWTILIFMALVIWIWMVIMVMIDIFSRPDLSGWGKAGWIVLIIVLPFIGVLCCRLQRRDRRAPRLVTTRSERRRLRSYARHRAPRIASDARAHPTGCERRGTIFPIK